MEFKQSVKEALNYYVYALVNPISHMIFYIGKGKGDRVFQHAEDALNENTQSLKLDTIREIISLGEKVNYFILRHNLTEEEAFLLESTLIDMLTYSKFNHENQLTNIASGYHQWDEGIKTIDEVNALYDCQKIEVNSNDRLLLVSLNRSFNQAKANGVYRRLDIYESTRKYWAIGTDKAQEIDYVLGVYKGIVRCVIKVESHKWVSQAEDGTIFKKPRCCFDGKNCTDSIYLNKDVTDYPFGSGGAIRYI
ncbi:MAG: endonuclease [Prevotellaceae bacterium]|nr:endonuclease [Candidatus Minthosoma equi]